MSPAIARVIKFHEKFKVMKPNNRKYFADAHNNKLALSTLHLRTVLENINMHTHNNLKRQLEYFLNTAMQYMDSTECRDIDD